MEISSNPGKNNTEIQLLITIGPQTPQDYCILTKTMEDNQLWFSTQQV